MDRKVAYIFPGQGSQYVGMGKDLYENNSIARELFQKADDMLGYDLTKLCFNGPEDELRQTQNTQPAIFLHSMVLFNLVKELNFDMTAGHSLGEYSALVAAGALSFEDGLRLVRLRGELMQKAGVEQPGTMAAIIGLNADIIESICKEASAEGIVQPANFNSPDQIIVSGSKEGVKKAMDLAKIKNAKLVKELPVSGAFHSPLMESAQSGLKKALENVNIQDLRIPVYTNVTALPVYQSNQIKEMLVRQLTSTVKWEQSVINMINEGANIFIEIGPGRVLQGLVKRINSSVTVLGYEKLSDLDEIEKKLL